MNKFLTLLGREVKSYFYSPVAYVVMCFFLFAIGLSFYISVSLLNRGPTEHTVVEAFFNTIPFWIAFLFIFPLITMRSFSEEFKLGTVEPLMTAPVGDWQVVLAKFFGALVFYFILWLPTASYFWIFQAVTGTAAAKAGGAYLGSYLMLVVMGMFFISVGIFSSVLTRNQIIAAVISFCANIVLLFAGLLTFFTLNVTPALRDAVGYFSTIEHMANFSKGILDTRPVVYYLSMTALMLFLTQKAFESRKWRM